VGVANGDGGGGPQQKGAVLVWGARGTLSAPMADYLAGHFVCVWLGAARQEVLRSVEEPLRGLTMDPSDPVGLGIARATIADAGPGLVWGLLVVEPDPAREAENVCGSWLDAVAGVCAVAQGLGLQLPLVLAFPQTRGRRSELIGAHTAAGALEAWVEAREASGGAAVRMLALPAAWWQRRPECRTIVGEFPEGPPEPGWDLRPGPSLRRGARKVLGRLGWAAKPS
jgi:hypothetical protein